MGKTILAVLLAVACGLLGWTARGQFDPPAVQAPPSEKVAAAPPRHEKAPPRASQPKAATPAARTAQQERPGNTDGGHLPWNGGDLYTADYSRLVRPASAGSLP
jgi:hypothetical protein